MIFSFTNANMSNEEVKGNFEGAITITECENGLKLLAENQSIGKRRDNTIMLSICLARYSEGLVNSFKY